MTRTAAREIAVQMSFFINMTEKPVEEALEEFFDKEYYATLSDEDRVYSEYPDNVQMGYIRRVTTGSEEKKAELDSIIEKYSKNWKLSRISKTALAILRVSIFEILHMEEIPNSAAINEAVELSKKYEEHETVSFINGVLGSVVRGELDAEEQ